MKEYQILKIHCTRIRELRKELGMTQSGLATTLGIKRCTIGAYEEGRAQIPHNILIKCCDLFGKSMDWFYNREATQIPVSLKRKRIITQIGELETQLKSIKKKASQLV